MSLITQANRTPYKVGDTHPEKDSFAYKVGDTIVRHGKRAIFLLEKDMYTLPSNQDIS
jgi:hypothetical protein